MRTRTLKPSPDSRGLAFVRPCEDLEELTWGMEGEVEGNGDGGGKSLTSCQLASGASDGATRVSGKFEPDSSHSVFSRARITALKFSRPSATLTYITEVTTPVGVR